MIKTGGLSHSRVDHLRLVCFNVGQGACTLLIFPATEAGRRRRYAVVDCNVAGADSVEYYLRRHEGVSGECELEFVALTHYDWDHFAGINRLAGAPGSPFRTRRFIGPPMSPLEAAEKYYAPSGPAAGALQQLYELTFGRYRTRKGRRCADPELCAFRWDQAYRWAPQLGQEVQIRALAPSPSGAAGARASGVEYSNLASGILRVQYGKTVALICGDVTEEEWQRILAHFAVGARPRDLLPANAALVPHHGGSGNPPELWERISRLSDHSMHLMRTARAAPGECRKARTKAVVSCGTVGNASRRTLLTLAGAKVAAYCTNPSQACAGLRGERRRPPPVCVAPPGGTPPAGSCDPGGIGPGPDVDDGAFLEGFPVGDDPGAQAYLRPFRADLLRGSVVIDLFPASAPGVAHMGPVSRHDDCLDALLE